MNIYQKILLSAILIIPASCATFDEAPHSDSHISVPRSFTGQFCTDDETRTSLGEGNSVLWDDNDSISLFAAGANNLFKALQLSEDKSNAVFAGSSEEASDYYALYPYDPDATIDKDGTICTSIPSVQMAVAGSFTRSTNVSVAKSDGKNLLFHNIGAILSIVINNENIESVTLSSDSVLTGGTASISVSGLSKPAVHVESGIKEVTIKGGLEQGKKYYFVVYPGSHPDGVNLCITDTKGNRALYSNSKKLDITANSNISLGTITVSDTKWIGPKANFNTSHICGVYDIKTDCAIYSYTRFTDQMVLTKGTTTSFRIQNPFEEKYIEVYGVPASLKKGDSFNGRLVQNYVESMDWNSYKTFNVIDVDQDGYVRLSDGEGRGYIIKNSSL